MDLVDYLQNELIQREASNPAYSLRAFARNLEIDASALSAILRRKRPVTVKMGKRLIANLGVSSQQRLELIKIINNKIKYPLGHNAITLEDEVFALIADWEHYAVLAHLTLKNQDQTVENLARRFGISNYRVRKALDRLHKLKLVAKEKGQWVALIHNASTSHDVPSQALREANRQYIEKAKDALLNSPVTERDITGVTLTCSENRMSEAKKLIADFRRKFCRLMEQEDDGDQVYRMNIQFFKLTK